MLKLTKMNRAFSFAETYGLCFTAFGTGYATARFVLRRRVQNAMDYTMQRDVKDVQLAHDMIRIALDHPLNNSYFGFD